MTPRQTIKTAEAAVKFVVARNARRNARLRRANLRRDGEPSYATLKSRQAVALRRLAMVVNKALEAQMQTVQKPETIDQFQFPWNNNQSKSIEAAKANHNGWPVDKSSNT